MAVEGESLGKSRLDLETNLEKFRREMLEGKKLSAGMGDSLQALAAFADIAEKALGDVKMSGFAAAESSRVADRIEGSTGRVGRAAMDASHHLEQVKLSAAQAAESVAAGDVIDRKLDDITDNANQARRALDRLRLAGVNVGGVGDGRRSRVTTTGVGVGPFGSGFGRIGAVGTAIGVGALTGPAAVPAAVGLLASIPTLAAGGVGVLGTLALAFKGLGAAIGGDLKAYNKLVPAQKEFVQTVRSLIPWIDRLKQTAGSNLFPGLTQGLHSALTPGTLAAITKAVAGFARAIGQAGTAWGKYFGSSQFQQIFGPLMAAGAHNLTLLADAALHLFDALGVLSRAAIPLTSWLAVAADKGAKLADAWLRSQDASGRLGKAMSEAQSSLRLVGGLLVAVGRAVVALGIALYPVSKVAVKDLTDGFGALAGIITRNQSVIREVVGGALDGLVGAVKLAAEGVQNFNHGLELFLGQKASVITAIALIGAALVVWMGPQSAAIAGAVIGIGLIAQHWSQISKFMVGAAQAAWSAIKGAFDLGVYGALFELTLIAKGVEKAFGWVPIIGPKIKAAFDAVDGWIDGFRQRGVAELGNAGAQMGAAWGSAFGAQTLANLKKVSGALGEWAAGHHKKALNDLAAQGFTTDLLTGKQIPTAAPQSAVPGIDFSIPGSSSTGSAFGTPPPFDTNVPKAKKRPLLPPLASRALDLASANASKASQLGNIGGTAKRYLDLELADLQTAVKLIRDKYDHSVGKVRSELFHALTAAQNKIRTVRTLIKEAIKRDRLAEIQFAIDLAELAMASSKEGSAAYKRAELHEEKLLRSEIAYLDKRVHNKKLSLALRQDALSAELSARQQLNALTGQTTDLGKVGANQAQFLSSFQQIVHSYAPNAFPEAPTMKPLETKGYETVDQLRRVNEKLARLVERTAFPASGYATTSAEAAFA